MSVFDDLYKPQPEQSEVDWGTFVEFNLQGHQPWMQDSDRL